MAFCAPVRSLFSFEAEGPRWELSRTRATGFIECPAQERRSIRPSKRLMLLFECA
jgi:hypothetical protein